jgi:hypothetical protein
MHGQYALHELDPPISAEPLPWCPNYTNDGLPAGMNVHVWPKGELLCPSKKTKIPAMAEGSNLNQGCSASLQVLF